MKTIFGLIVALSALFPPTVYSDEGKRVDLQLGIGSSHFEQRSDGRPWNQKNYGVAVQYVTPGTLWGKDVEYCATLGEVKNSEFGQTIFAGGCIRKTILKVPLGEISVGAFAGVMTYPSKYNPERKSNDLFLVILPTVTVSVGEKVYLDATFIPKVKVQGNQGSAAVLFTLRFPLKQW